MNALCPGSINRINTSGAGFKLMENIVVLQVVANLNFDIVFRIYI